MYVQFWKGNKHHLTHYLGPPGLNHKPLHLELNTLTSSCSTLISAVDQMHRVGGIAQWTLGYICKPTQKQVKDWLETNPFYRLRNWFSEELNYRCSTLLKKKNQLNSGGTISRAHYSTGKHGRHYFRLWHSLNQGPLCAAQHSFVLFCFFFPEAVVMGIHL